MSRNSKRNNDSTSENDEPKNANDEPKRTNGTTRAADLVLNVNKTKKLISTYHENFKLDKPMFRGGSLSYVYLTSIIEHLVVEIIKNSGKDVNENKDGKKEITRNKIINTIKGNDNTDIVFYEANKYYDPAVDYTENSIMKNSDLAELLDKYFKDDDTILTPQASMYIKYVISYAFNKCLYYLVVIKQNSAGKSITLDHIKGATRLFTQKLFKNLNLKAVECVKKVECYDDINKKKSNGKKPNGKKSDGKKSNGKKSNDKKSNKKKNLSDDEMLDDENESDTNSNADNSNDESDNDDEPSVQKKKKILQK